MSWRIQEIKLKQIYVIVIAAFVSGVSNAQSYKSQGENYVDWYVYQKDSSTCSPLTQVSDSDYYLTSKGPWWVDKNHLSPGAGPLYLIAFTWHRDYSVEGGIAPVAKGQAINIRNAKISAEIRFRNVDVPDSSKFGIWVQSQVLDSLGSDSPRMVNIFLKGKSLDPKKFENDWWNQLEFVLNPSSDDWICLGSSTQRAATYTCETHPMDLLRHFNVDLGFVIVFNENEIEKPSSGNIDFRNIRIETTEEQEMNSYVFQRVDINNTQCN